MVLAPTGAGGAVGVGSVCSGVAEGSDGVSVGALAPGVSVGCGGGVGVSVGGTGVSVGCTAPGDSTTTCPRWDVGDGSAVGDDNAAATAEGVGEASLVPTIVNWPMARQIPKPASPSSASRVTDSSNPTKLPLRCHVSTTSISALTVPATGLRHQVA